MESNESHRIPHRAPGVIIGGSLFAAVAGTLSASAVGASATSSSAARHDDLFEEWLVGKGLRRVEVELDGRC